MTWFSRLRPLLFALILAGIGLPAGSHAEGAPLLTQAPPTPDSVTLSAAATAERNGDFATAEADYRALAASAVAATAAQGNLGLGRLLVRQGRTADALAPLQAAMPALAGTPDGLHATFLLGEAQADQKQNQSAIASFQAYTSAGGAAAGYAALEVAWAAQAAGDDTTALADLNGALQASSLTVRRAALQAASQSLERLGNPAQAAADQQAIADSKPAASDRAAALLEAGRLYHLAADDADAVNAWQQVVQDYPSLTAAGTALDRLDTLGVQVDPMQRGLVLFDLHRNDDAQTVLQGVLNANPSADLAAQATYYLARIADRENQNDTALAGYANAYALSPTGSSAPAAIWYRAQLLRYLDRYNEAEGEYMRLAQQFPTDDNASEAAFDTGLMAYLDGRPADAVATWGTLVQGASGAAASRLDLWLGKLAQAKGDAATAATELAKAEADDPAGYYALRAEVLATGSSVALSGAPVTPPADDWGTVETWLTGWAGAEDPSQFATLQAAQDWTEGIELSSMGWKVTPNTLLGSALDGAAHQPWALYRAARALAGRGLTNLALQAADELLTLAPGSRFGAPATLLRLDYPVGYPDLVNQDAAQAGLDPLLIDAVVRQESDFDPVAGSSAGAQGLLQLEPATAQDVATALGLSNFIASDLQRPLINLQLGAMFLAQQGKTAGGEINQTLAAYNAGGGNAAGWAKQAAGDADRFYEAVDVGETRAYIRLVSENYAVYNLLYRNTARPTLLHP